MIEQLFLRDKKALKVPPYVRYWSTQVEGYPHDKHSKHCHTILCLRQQIREVN